MEMFLIIHFVVFLVWAVLGLSSPLAQSGSNRDLILIICAAFLWELALLSVVIQKLRGKL